MLVGGGWVGVVSFVLGKSEMVEVMLRKGRVSFFVGLVCARICASASYHSF